MEGSINNIESHHATAFTRLKEEAKKQGFVLDASVVYNQEIYYITCIRFNRENTNTHAYLDFDLSKQSNDEPTCVNVRISSLKLNKKKSSEESESDGQTTES